MRAENKRMKEWLASKGIKAQPKYIWDGSMRGRWRLYDHRKTQENFGYNGWFDAAKKELPYAIRVKATTTSGLVRYAKAALSRADTDAKTRRHCALFLDRWADVLPYEVTP